MAIMGAFRSGKSEAHQFDILPPASDARVPRRLVPAHLDVVDAEFEVISRDNSRQPFKVFNDNFEPREPKKQPTLPPIKPNNTFDSIVVAAEAALQGFSKTTFTGLSVLVFVTIFWAVGSMTLASHLPGSYGASQLAKEPLVISNVHLSLRKSNGLRILEVAAQIHNQSDKVQVLPAVRLDLVPGIRSGVPLTISPMVSSLKPGETTGFTARYPYSGEKLPDARIAFEAKGAPAL